MNTHRRRQQIQAAIERNRPNVQARQVWEDCDKRMAGRKIAVLSVSGNYARCRHQATGKTVNIRIDRMRPNSTGWRLVQAADGD